MPWGSQEYQPIQATKELARSYLESRTLENANRLLEASLTTHPDVYMHRVGEHVAMTSHVIRMIVADEIATDVLNSTDRDTTESNQAVSFPKEETDRVVPVKSRIPFIRWFAKRKS
jgi:hypothetical protein